jgi:ethanolamine utilization protein EutN
MLLGKVTGTAVATIKTPELTGAKLLVVQPLTKHLEPSGPPKVAVDTVHAGVGDVVFLVRSREASLALDIKGTPTDLAIIGVVDTVNLDQTVQSFELPYGRSSFP